MKKEKTIPELAKEFPEKTYRELEKYRDADRIEEAIGMGHNQPPADGEEQDNPELFKTEIDYHRYWKDMYEKEHKLRQEAETETILVKGIGINSPEMRDAKKNIEELQSNLERTKKENNDLFNRIADALEVNESHQKLNGKLQERLTELEEENKKVHDALNKRINNMRKSGM
jgi:DNA repair exonuclease SbcCD ATPase subunit